MCDVRLFAILYNLHTGLFRKQLSIVFVQTTTFCNLIAKQKIHFLGQLR